MKTIPASAASTIPLALAALMSCILVWAAPALAHRVNIFAWPEGDVIHTESAFSGGKKVNGGLVRVLDAGTGDELLTGKTGKDGKFSFAVPDKARTSRADLNIVLEASMGHRGQWTVAADEYLGPVDDAVPALDAATGNTSDTTPDTPRKTTAASTTPSPGTKPLAAPCAKAANLEAIVAKAVDKALNKAMDKHLSPLRRMLAEQQTKGPGMAEIIGGLGWIIGLVGIGAYFRSKGNN